MLAFTRHAKRRIRVRKIRVEKDMPRILARVRDLEREGRCGPEEIPVDGNVYVIGLEVEPYTVITAYTMKKDDAPPGTIGHARRIRDRRRRAAWLRNEDWKQELALG